MNVFRNSSNHSEKKIDTTLFVQEPYLRTNYIESNLEEDIDSKSQYGIKIYLILLTYEKQLQKTTSIINSKILVY